MNDKPQTRAERTDDVALRLRSEIITREQALAELREIWAGVSITEAGLAAFIDDPDSWERQR